MKTGELWRNLMNGQLVEVVDVMEPHCLFYVWINHPERVQSRPLSKFNADFELEETSSHVAETENKTP